MYIAHHKNKKYKSRKKKGQMEFSPKDFLKENKKYIQEPEKYKELEAPEDMLIEEYSGEVYLQWSGPEFEIAEHSRKWYFCVVLIFLAVVSYALFTNSLVMAIVFILIGMVAYIHIHKEPRILNFAITNEGVIAGREIYEFENLKSFWIFYEPGGLKTISLHTNGHFVPYVHIPIHLEDPITIREILIKHISEKKHEKSILDIINNFLKL